MSAAQQHKPVTPLLTVDIIIEMADRPGRPIVLIERKYPPHGWAVPGGFVDVGETLEAAAVREAKEETSLDIRLTSLLGNYSDPTRDARGQPVAADDARHLEVFDPAGAPPLVFDHAQIIADYLAFRKTGRPAPLRRGTP